MPRKDTFHDIVKSALVKDGWLITHDPYMLEYNSEPERDMFLAMPKEAFDEILNIAEGQKLIEKESLKLVLYAIEEGMVLRWIE